MYDDGYYICIDDDWVLYVVEYGEDSWYLFGVDYEIEDQSKYVVKKLHLADLI